MFDAVLTMLHMQDRMNRRVHPQWIEQDFAWHRAIWVECAELLEHHGYKWWKRQEPDWPQVQLEVIDVWHFGMSARFAPELPDTELARALAAELQAAKGGKALPDAVEALAAIAAGDRRFCGTAFAELMHAAGLDFDELYRQYLGKNVLNFFRQDHGYKEGTYRKLWNGREDNEHLMELLAAIDTAGTDADEHLYRALAERYRATAAG
jgi:hypothetical protein